MNLLTIFRIELKKIRRTHIFWILLIPLILLWIPAVLNADSSFGNAAGLSPEMNFFFQSYLGMSWFMYPASLVVITVMLNRLCLYPQQVCVWGSSWSCCFCLLFRWA